MLLTQENYDLAYRRLLQMHYESGVGHIGGNLSCLNAMLLLHHEFLDCKDYKNKIILSKGHAAGTLYICLWSIGKITDEDLKRFHLEGTELPGHPPANKYDDVLFATGSLGHGLSLAAGTALAYKMKGIKSQVYCVMSDGEWQEGSTWEAAIFATHHNLNNLTLLIDHNNIQGFGTTNSVASMSPLSKKVSGLGFKIISVDGHNTNQIRDAINEPSETSKFIELNTIKGFGVSFMENKMEWHYLPLTKDLYEKALAERSKK